MVAVNLRNNDRMETIFAERTIKWQLKELIDECNYNREVTVQLPEHLLPNFDEDLIKDGCISIEALVE